MKNILILEPDQQKVPQLVFLLNLADIRCTVVKSLREVQNWLHTDQITPSHFDLFLLNSSQAATLETKGLEDILKKITIPTVYVQRENTPPPEHLINQVSICYPDNLLSCLHQPLSSDLSNN